MASTAQEVRENTNEKSETTRFLEAAKDFSFEQKLSVVQSILAKIPREQQQPWNAPPLLKEKQTTTIPAATAVCQEGDEIGPRPPTSTSKRVVVDEAGDNIKSTTKADSDEAKEETGNVFEEYENTERSKPQAPPLIDPYEKSMRYYEKHLILNHFQVQHNQPVRKICYV